MMPTTAEEWDVFWRTDRPGWGERYKPIFEEAEKILRGQRRVHEFGFGTLRFARLIGPERWVGHDVSSVAVVRARGQGFRADSMRAGDAPPFRVSAVCAFQMLSYLDEKEREDFLGAASGAPLAVFSDCRQSRLQCIATIESFESYLLRWWPSIYLREFSIGRRVWMLAECVRAKEEK